MMTSAEIRQSYLDFFRQQQHTIVASSSLLPDAPNLLFTNAGMNQFVPIFLGQAPCPYTPARVADTQKCIRAGGKHNDLEDVGWDTYHHTFFEMLGNWSFGDYFKREAIDWAWELVVHRWKFPPARLYTTYFGGDDKIPPDTEARELWRRHLPADHVVAGNRRDNFWMMGDTGPCGPCSELHVDLTPDGRGGPQLVNAGTAHCIEIWNLVFIQFNANADGSLAPLPARHVDTGMGLERVCGIVQCTNGLTDFRRLISNYDTDLFGPLFRALEDLSGRSYRGLLPGGRSEAPPAAVQTDIAFRVIADHSRCLCCAVADGILPSNEGRGYVLRRILRRAVRYGRHLGLREPFFYKLTDVVAARLGDVFPELRQQQERIRTVLRAEEESFNRTLDRGLEIFEETVAGLSGKIFPAAEAFKLYDTYGFPLDLTELMARERGLTVDVAGVENLMEQQRERARQDYAKKKTVIAVVSEGLEVRPTRFLGYDHLEAEAVVEAVSPRQDEIHLVFDQTPFYAEMGGQVGDTGLVWLSGPAQAEAGRLEVLDTQKQGELFLHRARLVGGRAPEVGEAVRVAVDATRRGHIQRHHTATHLFHWALHEVVSRQARQRGSLVSPERMRFDFNQPQRLTGQQLADIERLVNERIRENLPVSWVEVSYAEVRGNPDILQFFGEKYGKTVRVVQIGGRPGQLDGFSMELCGGTHTRTTGEIGLFAITRESAVAAGIRRVEAVAGPLAEAYREQVRETAAREAAQAEERERQRQAEQQRQAETIQRAAAIAAQLPAQGIILRDVGPGDAAFLRAVMDALKPRLTSAVVVLGAVHEGKVALLCHVTADRVGAGQHAGRIVGELARICGGAGGGRPDQAAAGGRQPEKLPEALEAARRLLG